MHSYIATGKNITIKQQQQDINYQSNEISVLKNKYENVLNNNQNLEKIFQNSTKEAFNEQRRITAEY